MTTAKTPKSPPAFRLPDPPKSPDEKMTAAKQLTDTGHAHHLTFRLGEPETTIVTTERYITLVPTSERADMTGVLYPDLLVAFNVDPVAFEESNAYVISEQGKPPDFVLEIASRSTGRSDTDEKRAAYAALGITEYWRFDETGQYHGARLAGDRLVNGRYEPIEINVLPDGNLSGHSAVLGLELHWTNGLLGWHDPDTGDHIATFDTEREGRLAEREGRLAEREGRLAEREGRLAEREARLQAEARVRELEEELQQLKGD